MNSRTGQTRRRIFTLDGSNEADSRKHVPFFGGGTVSLILLLILGVKYPQKPQFWGVNERFQAKWAIYWKFHVIETTASILTKFGTTIETITLSSWVVPLGTQQIQNGGRPPFWKKNVKSPYLCDCSADCDEIWQDGAYWPKFMSDWNLFGGRPGLGIFGELGVQLTLLRGAGTINSVGKNLVEESILKFTGLLVIIVNETRAAF